MKSHLQLSALAALLAIACAAPTQAQDQQAAPAQKPIVTPLKVTITISRYQGEKRISSLPYILNLVHGERSPNNSVVPAMANLRVGTRVPITSTTTGGGTPVPTVTYQDVGTSIDCSAYAADGTGSFRLQISIDESSVYDDPAAKGPIQIGRPTLRTFRTTDSLVIKDGQSAQLSNTPDRMTGETIRVDVALAVVK